MTDEHGMPGKVPLSSRTRPPVPVNPKTLITPEQRSAAAQELQVQQDRADGRAVRLVLLLAGFLAAALGLLVVFTATSIFVAVLGGAIMTCGAVYSAAGITIGALKR